MKLYNFIENKLGLLKKKYYNKDYHSQRKLILAMYTANSLKAELNAKGWRLTPQREIILQVFQNLTRGKHLSAEDVFDLRGKRGENISLWNADLIKYRTSPPTPLLSKERGDFDETF